MIFIRPGAVVSGGPFVMTDAAMSGAAAVGSVNVAMSDMMLSDNTSQFWREIQVSTPSRTVALEFPAPVTVDTICIAGHNFGSGAVSVRPHYSVEADSAYLSWGGSGVNLPPNDAPVCLMLPPVTGQRFRLTLAHTAGAQVLRRLSIFRVGLRLELPCFVTRDYTPAPFADRSEVFPSVTLGGQYVAARIKRRAADLTVPFSPIPRAFVDGPEFRAFRAHYNQGRPIFFGGAPVAMPDDLSFGWRPEGAPDLRPAYSQGGRFARVSLEMACHVN